MARWGEYGRARTPSPGAPLARRRQPLRRALRICACAVCLAAFAWLMGQAIEGAGRVLAMKATRTSPADLDRLGLRP